MTLIDDVIELANADGLVHATALEPDGCDSYNLRGWPSPVTVWVRPDGRFSRAEIDGHLVTLGQVTQALRAAIRYDAVRSEGPAPAPVAPAGARPGPW